MQSKMAKGYAVSVLSAVIYGLMPLMAKHIYADGVNALTLVFLRNFLALPSLAVWVWFSSRSFRVPVRALPAIGLLSFFGCCATPILLFSSYQHMATGTATVIHFVYPALVVVFGVLFLKKKVPLGTILSVVLCFAGICLFYDPSAGFSLKGGAYALSSAVTFAVYVTLLPSLKSNPVKGLLLTFYTAAFSSLFTLAICLATGSLALPRSLNGWILCAVFAFLVTTVAVVCFQQGAFLIGGEKTSIVSAIEPITGVVVGAVVFREAVTPQLAIGSLFVVGASILIVVSDIAKKKKAK